MTTMTARQHSNTAANRASTAEHAEHDARQDRAKANSAPTAADAQTHADNSSRAAMTARDAAHAAEYHAAQAQSEYDRLLLWANAAIADDRQPALDAADAAEDAWIAARRDAAQARLAADLAQRHASIAQETAKQRRQEESIRQAAAARQEAEDATAAAIATGETERDAHAALLAAAVLFGNRSGGDTAELEAALAEAAECYAAAVEEHAAALLREQDAYDRLPMGNGHKTSRTR